MAGKTLPGVGKDGDKSGGKDAKPAPPPARDSAAPRVPERNTAPYSGPTVVDDDKVAEGLKKLRSLDEPLGPPSAVGQSVADPSSADVTRVGGPGTPTAGFPGPASAPRSMTPPTGNKPKLTPTVMMTPPAPVVITKTNVPKEPLPRTPHPSPRAGTKTLLWTTGTPPPEPPPPARLPASAQETPTRPMPVSAQDTPTRPMPAAAPATTASTTVFATPPPTAASGTVDARPREQSSPTFVSSATRGTMYGTAPSLPSAIHTTPTHPSLPQSQTPTVMVPIPEGADPLMVTFPDDDSRGGSPKAPRGTAVGHSVSTPGGTQNIPELPDDRAYKGTLHGHMLHLPDLPETHDDGQPATVLAEPSPTTAGQFTALIPDADLSTSSPGIAQEPKFYETELPEDFDRPRGRGRLFARAMIFVSVISLFVIAAVVWVRWRRADAPAPLPSTAAAPLKGAQGIEPTAPPPSALPPPSQAATEPAAAPSPSVRVLRDEEARQAVEDDLAAGARPAPRAPEPAPPARTTTAVPYQEHPPRVTDMPGRAEGKPPERPTLGARRHAATAEPPPPHTVRVVPPAVPRAPRAPAKHTDDDPDGTLPPSD